MYKFLFNLFHRHTWTALKQNEAGDYVMRCCDCGLEHSVTADITVSSEMQRRQEQARIQLKNVELH